MVLVASLGEAPGPRSQAEAEEQVVMPALAPRRVRIVAGGEIDLEAIGQELLHELLALRDLGPKLEAPFLQSHDASVDELALGHAEEGSVLGHMAARGNRCGPQVDLRPVLSYREPLCEHVDHCPAYPGRIDHQAHRASLTECPGGLELPEPGDDPIGYPLVGGPQWWAAQVPEMQLVVVGRNSYPLTREKPRLAHHLALAYGDRHSLEHGHRGVVRGLPEVSSDPVPH